MFEGYWLALAIYFLGVAFYLMILEEVEDSASNAVLVASFLWPYIAVVGILELIVYGRGEE